MKKAKKKIWQPTFKKFLFWYFPTNWEDLGNVENLYIGNGLYEYLSHLFCGKKLRIGRHENGAIFYFCGKCRVQVKDKNGNMLYTK